MSIEGLQTPRLRGEPIGPAHREGLIAMLGDPRVGATLGGAATPADVDRQIAAMAAHWAAHGYGWYQPATCGTSSSRRSGRTVKKATPRGPSSHL